MITETGGLVIVTSERGGYIGRTDERDIFICSAKLWRNFFVSPKVKKKEDEEHFR